MENVRVAGAEATRHGDSPVRGGRAGWSADWYHSITDYRICTEFNMKMDNDVLLLCYLDKICLTLTGNQWRALASLYSEARLYKGARTATHPQSTTLHSTGNISLWTKEVGHSNTRGTVRLCSFLLKLLLHNSLHFQHLMWTKGYSFKTSTVKRSLFSIVHVNS